MNPDSVGIRPDRAIPILGGIEWEFHPQEHGVVTHLPTRHGGVIYAFGCEAAPVDVADPLHRSLIRALLQNALRELDATEPVNPNGAPR